MADANVKSEAATPQKSASPAGGNAGRGGGQMTPGGGRGGFVPRGGRGGGGGMGRGGMGGPGGPMRGGGRGGQGGGGPMRGGNMGGGRGGRGGGPGHDGGRGSMGGNFGGSNMSLDQGSQGGGGYGRGKPRSLEERVMEKLANFFSGPTTDLPAKEAQETRKFSGHCRLYVGNVPADLTDEEFVNLFTPFGETSEPFVNRDKMFGFIKLDYRSSAERAKNALDQTLVHGKNIKVRYAQHGAIVKVKNLSPWVSNELLEKAMSIFGEVEKAIVTVDARGKALGEGVVEFVQKPAAQTCVKMLTDGCFFLTSSPRPVIAELVTEQDDDDGLPEKNLPKRHHEYQHEREMPPRFAEIGSFEYEYGGRWRELHELEKQKLEAVKAEMRFEREKLEAQMEYAKQDAEINQLRKQLRQRELEKEDRMRKQDLALRHMEETRKREEEIYREREREMTQNMTRREESLRLRAQANHMFLQEAAFVGGEVPGNFDAKPGANGAAGYGVPPPPQREGRPEGNFAGGQGGYEWEQGPSGGMMERDNYGGKFGPDGTGGQPGPAGMMPGRQWGRGPGDRGRDDYQQASKRGRF